MTSRSDIETLLEDILVDAYGEDEQLWAFRQVIEDEVPLPTEGTVIGETVQVTKIVAATTGINRGATNA